MTHIGYIVAGYGLTAALIGGYAWWVRSRTRALLQHQPDGADPRRGPGAERA